MFLPTFIERGNGKQIRRFLWKRKGTHMINHRYTKSLTIALLFLIVLAAFGCGGASPEEPAADDEPGKAETEPGEEVADPPEAEEEEPEEEESVPSVTGIGNPSNTRDIVENFSHLKWSVSGLEDGEATSLQTYTYSYEGKDTIEGEEMDKITLANGDVVNSFWVKDGSGQYMATDGELADYMQPAMVQAVLRATFAPFTIIRNLGIPRIVNDSPAGWTVDVLGRETKTFGELEASVLQVRASAEPPAVEPGNDVSLVWHIADFGGFELVVLWETEGESGDGMYSFVMEIEEVGLR